MFRASAFKICLLVWCLSLTSTHISAQVVIVHPDNVDTELSRINVRAIFATRTTQWSDSSAIQVFVMNDASPLHNSFCTHVLGMFSYQLRRIWDKRIFSGKGEAPNTVHSEQEMYDRVSQTKGAIGYIQSAINSNDVKIIEVTR